MRVEGVGVSPCTRQCQQVCKCDECPSLPLPPLTCAKSVMPTVAMSPLGLAYSWLLAYLAPSSTANMQGGGGDQEVCGWVWWCAGRPQIRSYLPVA